MRQPVTLWVSRILQKGSMTEGLLQWGHKITDTYVIGLTGLVQILLLVVVAELPPIAAALALIVGALTIRTIKKSGYRSDNSLLMITASGGLGMLLGAMLDMATNANGFHAVHQQISGYLHHRGLEARILGSYMALVMLLFCIPCCVIWCSKPGQNTSLAGACLRHGIVGIPMLMGMLVFPHFALGHLSWAFRDFSIESINPFLHHHLAMLAGMFLGALCGYGIYDRIEKYISVRRSKTFYHD